MFMYMPSFFLEHRLANENAIKEIQNKMREVQKENDELLSNLAKKERECEIKLEETVCICVICGYEII